MVTQNDCPFARLLLKGREDGAAAQFITTLFLAAQKGHLCLTLGDAVSPDLETLWLQAYGPNHGMSLEAIRKGAAACPEELIADVSQEPPLKPICREENRYYLQKLWRAEEIFKRHYRRLTASPPVLKIPSLNRKLPLTEEQARAVETSLGSSLSIISGGPGTGKTYTAGVLVHTLWNSLSDAQKESVKILLAAPTGKAAKNLQKSFQRLEGLPPLQAKTLHSALGLKANVLEHRAAPLPADVILIDECSMIDVSMMASLMGSVRSGARLILLGDSHQLPPVEAGSLFSDMMTMGCPAQELTKCLRTESKGIIELSRTVYLGDDSRIHEFRLDIPAENDWKAQQPIVDWASRHFPKPPAEITPENFAQTLQSYCLLSPLRKGPLGVDALNEKIKTKLSERSAVPIMIVKNSPQLKLCNGDTGLLVDNDKALFMNEEGKLRQIAKLLLPDYEYAYCMSVHKSQGSEFDRVTLLMPQGSEIFGREVFYTGVTRARKRLDIWGKDETLKAAIAKKTIRNSGLR